MKNNRFDKVVIVILICICAYLVLSNLKQREESNYYIDPKPYKICGEEIYVTDYTYNSKLDVQSLFNEIELTCNTK